jgi:hypothetical protein
MHMKRRTLLQRAAAVLAMVPFDRIKVFAQPRELTPDAVGTLHTVAVTVLPASIGAARIKDVVDKFVAWTRGYREVAALESAARAKGGTWQALDLETRRAILDAALVEAGVRTLPPRPMGQHVVADLMAFYFRSSEANDVAYKALINREVCRPIAITTRKPAPLNP